MKLEAMRNRMISVHRLSTGRSPRIQRIRG